MPLAPSSTALRVMSPPDRVHSAWNGACVLTSLSPFGDMWVTNKEWEEEGRKIIHQKALLWCVCSNRRNYTSLLCCFKQEKRTIRPWRSRATPPRATRPAAPP